MSDILPFQEFSTSRTFSRAVPLIVPILVRTFHASNLRPKNAMDFLPSPSNVQPPVPLPFCRFSEPLPPSCDNLVLCFIELTVPNPPSLDQFLALHYRLSWVGVVRQQRSDLPSWFGKAFPCTPLGFSARGFVLPSFQVTPSFPPFFFSLTSTLVLGPVRVWAPFPSLMY